MTEGGVTRDFFSSVSDFAARETTNPAAPQGERGKAESVEREPGGGGNGSRGPRCFAISSSGPTAARVSSDLISHHPIPPDSSRSWRRRKGKRDELAVIMHDGM